MSDVSRPRPSSTTPAPWKPPPVAGAIVCEMFSPWPTVAASQVPVAFETVSTVRLGMRPPP
jgi:hypothetical protein